MFAFLPGRQPLVYYMCANTPQNFDFETLPNKVNWQALVIQVLSIGIHTAIQVKIKLYKNKLKKEIQALPYHEHLKQDTLHNLETQMISNFATNTANALVLGSIVFVSGAVNRISPSQIVECPNYLLMYFYQLVFPFLFMGSITLIYYLRHTPMKKAIAREIKIIPILDQFHDSGS